MTSTRSYVSGFAVGLRAHEILCASVCVTRYLAEARKLEAAGLLTVTETGYLHGARGRMWAKYELTGMGSSIRLELKERNL